jgi:hypothetical protein
VAEPPGFDIGDAFSSVLDSIECLAFPAVIVFFVGSFFLSLRAARRRRMEYLPPTLAVEGSEIRRGLTAPEAAILMEMSLDRVLTLISFGLVRKSAMAVLSREPLRVEPTAPAPEGLSPYEVGFLDAIRADGRLDEARLRAVVVELIQTVNRKMKGFSRRDTTAYYRSIVAKAWERVQAGDHVELSDELLGETIEWTSLDKDFERRAPEVWVGRTFRRPIWWPNYVPRGEPARGGDGGGRTVSLPEVSVPSLPGSEFANTVVGGLEGFANNVVGSIESFTSGVTKVTNPPPAPSRAGSGRGGSSGGCACACACAGCACACAGGGR